jgi:hypothetical protein
MLRTSLSAEHLTHMTIFGSSSLGVVSAEFKTLDVCFSFGDIEGEKLLEGFEPQGAKFMVEPAKADKGKNTGRCIIET